MKINSRWQRRVGIWDEKLSGYFNREVIKMPDKELEIVLENNILKFIGGPTGFEAYYVEDLLRNSEERKGHEMCICAGTINSWPECYVQYDDVYNLIKGAEK